MEVFTKKIESKQCQELPRCIEQNKTIHIKYNKLRKITTANYVKVIMKTEISYQDQFGRFLLVSISVRIIKIPIFFLVQMEYPLCRNIVYSALQNKKIRDLSFVCYVSSLF
jgi:hypothetical protein